MMRPVFLLAAGLALGGCVTTTGGGNAPSLSLPLIEAPGSKQPVSSKLEPGKFEPSLMSIGSEKELAQTRGKGLGFVRSEAVEGYLKGIRDRLLKVSGVTDVPGKVRLLANPAFNASASADGNIYVAMGWLSYLESEDEIAAIVAHELSHVLLKHHSTDIIGALQKKAQSSHELLLGTKSALQQTQVGQSDQKALLAMQIMVEAVDKIAMPAWNRRQESEADLLGTDLMIRAGYAPEAMVGMLEKLRAWEKQNKESEEQFRARVEQLAKENLGNAVKASVDKLLGDLSANHPDSDSRIDAVAEYLDKFYGDKAFPNPDAASLKKLRAQRQVGTQLRNYDLAFSAQKLLLKGQVKTAYSYAQDAVRGPTARDAYPNWILAKAANGLGRYGEANAALGRAVQSEEPIREIYVTFVETHERAGNLPLALQWVDKAGAAFGDSPQWAPDRIRILKKMGKSKEAFALMMKCSLETPEIRRDCQAAGQGLESGEKKRGT